jgi:hypothetical protein
MMLKSKRLLIPAFVVTTFFAAMPAFAQSCSGEVGSDVAQTYVQHCLEVSPATRPPCNEENACQLIVSEIWRGCDMLGEDRPAFCADYCALVDYDADYDPPVYCGG